MTVTHMNPYSGTAFDYRKKHWFGTLPLPYRKKLSPPTGYSGREAPYPELTQVKEWVSDGIRHNICVRLAAIDKQFEVIGIDVDHYMSGDKSKLGGDQLQILENKFGALPPTWISSSRTDGVSGIRYFKVPKGFEFDGQVDKDIECIQKKHRYAVVWPSVHPEQGVYWWFPPGVAPDAEGKKAWDGEIPDTWNFPELPEPWFNFLTKGGTTNSAHGSIDSASSVSELDAWADLTFYGDENTPPCSLMRKKIELHKKAIAADATSHDKIVNAHFNLICLAFEGHMGYIQAINEIEQFWIDDVLKRGKRGMDELMRELWRSRTNAFRRVKAKSDDRVKIGAAPVDVCCEKTGMCSSGGQPASGAIALPGALDGDERNDGEEGVESEGQDDIPPDDPFFDIPRGPVIPVDEYEMNDKGNATHLRDMFSSVEHGPAFHFVDGHGWIIWHAGDIQHGGEKQPRWVHDTYGDQEMFRLFELVRKRQALYVDALQVDYEQQLANFTATGGGGPVPGNVKAAKVKFEKWKSFWERNGNVRSAENAIRSLRSLPGVARDINDLDANKFLLGVANGVVELDRDNVRLRPAMQSDLITLNTGVAYREEWSDVKEFARDMWEGYLNLFIPNLELRKAIQVALGHCIIGGNPEKVLISLVGQTDTGKSTMVNTVLAALGEYAQSVDQGIFKTSHFNPMLTKSLNKRMIICSEFDANDALSASQVKRMTGNTDKIATPIKNSMAIAEGIPQFVSLLATNAAPQIAGADKALENRLLCIPFNNVPKEMKRSGADQMLVVCKEACLHWLVEGYKEYRRLDSLIITEEMEQTKIEFMADLDDASAFIEECLVKHSHIDNKRMDWRTEPDWCITRSEMAQKYKMWCIENEIPLRDQLSAHALTKRLKAFGIPGTQGTKTLRIRDNSTRWWFGVKMKNTNNSSVVSFKDFQIKTQSEVEEEQ